jgi:hypothetical protein
MGAVAFHHRVSILTFSTLSGLVATAASHDAVSLQFGVVEYVDFSLADRNLSFTVASFDSAGQGEDRKLTHYRLISNCDTPRRIVASVAVAPPVGTSLEIQVDPPTASGSSLGSRFLGTSPVELVQGIGKVNEGGIPIRYTFRASYLAAIGTFAPEVTFSVIP